MSEPPLTAPEQQVLAELRVASRRFGLRSAESDQTLVTLRRYASARFGGSVTALLTSALDTLSLRGQVAPLVDRTKRTHPLGKDWVAIVAPTMNIDLEEVTLANRRKAITIPEGISVYYNCTTNSSSQLRGVITTDALSLVARIVVGNYEQRASPRIIRAKAAPDQQIRTTIRQLISQHGLDDDSWADALSGQYFLALLGRQLGMTGRKDYQDMLNRFLASFTYRVDDTLVLNEKHILVTPEEAEHIRTHMALEDQSDPYFAQQPKHRTENIDIDALHRNYLYGLTLGIAADSASNVLKTVRDLALSNLLGPVGAPSPMDLDGGWVPYRVPWLTARILISMRLLPEDLRRDRDLRAVELAAAQSLIDRVTESATWRSGVGDWVTRWESTGLCLEALIMCQDPSHAEVVSGVSEELRDSATEWRVTPSFADPEQSNATLAAAIVSCCLILASRSSSCDFELRGAEDAEMRSYLAEVLVSASAIGSAQPRQFCTIPQAMYYAARVLDSGE